jgi:hypothetical protein
MGMPAAASGRLQASAVEVVPSHTTTVLPALLQATDFAFVLHTSWWLQQGDEDGELLTMVARAGGRCVLWCWGFVLAWILCNVMLDRSGCIVWKKSFSARPTPKWYHLRVTSFLLGWCRGYPWLITFVVLGETIGPVSGLGSSDVIIAYLIERA